MSERPCILIVEDEPRYVRLLRANLESLGYEVASVATGQEVERDLPALAPSLVILDLMLPDVDGFEVCERVRAVSDVPIIVLTARVQQADVVRGLKLGADDYVTKPFDMEELLARIEAVLRRSASASVRAEDQEFSVGDLMINFAERRVKVAGSEIPLTRTEYRLLSELARHAGRVLVADHLLSAVWGREYRGEYRSLHLYVSRLRRKLGDTSRSPRYIVTRYGVGYALRRPGVAGEPVAS
ncbi:MAG: response regulator transcription factor [Chloroflexi bacterium]|nr:response regulator transcription factor [Chloroflexota bacterium]MBI4504359.1 response regulator transcription factor [Chloroflexota bacterium]